MPSGISEFEPVATADMGKADLTKVKIALQRVVRKSVPRRVSVSAFSQAVGGAVTVPQLHRFLSASTGSAYTVRNIERAAVASGMAWPPKKDKSLPQ